MPIDPILSLVVAVLIVRSTWQLLAQSIGVLMEGVPAHLDYEDIGRALCAVDGVVSVHDLHVWHMAPRTSRCRRMSRSPRAALARRCSPRRSGCWPSATRSST